MKKILLALLILTSFAASAQYTPPPGYTYINSRNVWFTGLFRALGIPAGGSVAWASGQAHLAGAMFYDSTGVDSGLYVWTGTFWRNHSQSTTGFFSPDQTSTGNTLHDAANFNFQIDNINDLTFNTGNTVINGTNDLLFDAQGRLYLEADDSIRLLSATGTLNIPNLIAATDTIPKPIARYSDGRLRQLSYWPGGGGGVDDSAYHRMEGIDDTTVVFHSNVAADTLTISGAGGGVGNLIVQPLGTGVEVLDPRNDTLYHRAFKNTATVTWDTASTGEIQATAVGGGGGITSLNSLTGGTQTFATGATGTDFNISSSGTTHTFNIPDASATARGLVTTGSQVFAGFKYFGTDSYAGTDQQINVAGNAVFGGGNGNSEIIISSTNITTGSQGLGFRTNTGTQVGLIRTFGSAFASTLYGLSVAGSMAVQSLGNNKDLLLGANAGKIYLAAGSAGVSPGLTVISTGQVGLNAITSPTAWLHLPASTTTANQASIKIGEGSRQTTPEDGTINYVANNLEFVETSTVYTLAKTLTATATLDFASTGAGAVADLTITVTGAADGDAVTIGVPNGAVTATATYTAWVSAANTVTVRFSPKATEDPASGTFRASVIKY